MNSEEMVPGILAVIPARGGSKSIERKNIRPLLGRPLIEYTFAAAKESKLLDRIILTTDDEEIAGIGRKNGIEVPFLRPGELASDECPTLPVIQHAVKFLEKNDNYTPDYIAILQPTSPLRRAEHIDEALRILIDTGADSVVSVIEMPHCYNPYSIMKIENDKLVPFMADSEKYSQRQLKPKFYARNGAAVYAFTYRTLMQKNSLYGDDCRAYFMSREDSIDIDDLIDFEFAEFILSRRRESRE